MLKMSLGGMPFLWRLGDAKIILRCEGSSNDLFTKERTKGDSLGIYIYCIILYIWYNKFIYIYIPNMNMNILWIYIYIYCKFIHVQRKDTDLEYLVILKLAAISSGSLWRLGRNHIFIVWCFLSQTLWPRHFAIYRLLPSQKLHHFFSKIYHWLRLRLRPPQTRHRRRFLPADLLGVRVPHRGGKLAVNTLLADKQMVFPFVLLFLGEKVGTWI